MAPIDLPPEPALSQLPTVSISTVSSKTKQSPEVRRFTRYLSTSRSLTGTAVVPSVSPRSLLPAEQLSAPADDLATPNLAQLPPLPPDNETVPASTAPASVDEETLDTINQSIDEVVESEQPEPAGIDLDAALDIDQLPQIDLDSVESSDLEPSDPELRNLELEALELEQVPGSLEDTDLDRITSDQTNPPDTINEPESDVDFSIPDTDNTTPPESTDILPTDVSEPLDPSTLEITADTQIFDSTRQVVIARGNVVFKLNNALLLADEMWINLVNRYVLAEGNVVLTRGEQEVRGERAEYNLLQEAGTIFETRGELFLPQLEDDFASPLEEPLTSRTVFDPLNPDQDVTNVRREGGFEISSRISGNTPGSLPEGEGGLRRLRFEAARVNFDAETWVAEEVRLTNDPFSPPELEFRTDRITLVSLSPTADLLTTEKPRLVFDQGLSLPLFRSRYVLNREASDSNQINPFLIGIGSDSRDRGGVFLESELSLVQNESTSLSITPQYFLERASNQGLTDSESFGFEFDFNTRLSPRSNIAARAEVTSLDLNQFEDNVRGSIRNRYLIGNHLLSTEYSYRDRLFNGSLGFQTVRSSLGAVLLSPPINLDRRGLILTYQAGAQWVTARTDRTDLLGRRRRGGDEDLITLGRTQASARLRKRFNLWRGKPLPATQTEGLRYTPAPIVPFLNLSVNLLGVGSYYTSGDFQEELSADVRIDGQVGHLSRNFFDYTRFNLGYAQDILSSDSSPFLFDRNVDRRVVSFGVLQQIFGPILLGFQTSININTGERINTDIILEYSRRTYGLVVRYSPTRETGSIGFRLSDFNWIGSGSPFDERSIRQVDSGIVEPR